MKKLLVIASIAVMMLGSCSKNTKEQDEVQQEFADATQSELIAAVADRDQLLNLVSEISNDMNQIKQLESILTVSGNNETPNQREQIRADIAAIQKTLEERRELLKQLEGRLAKSNKSNTALKNTIAALRTQLDQQTQEISVLQANLDDARAQIGRLDNAVDSLNTTVTNVTAQRDSTDRRNQALTTELNLCYYAIGTKAELKANRIIETGFLRKTKLMKGDFDRSFFTTADKRNLTTLDLNSNKAEILTNQPAGSYVISQANGHKVLRITNPAAFWSLSNYLVIQID